MRRDPNTRSAGAVALAALVLAGCVEYEDPPISWEGEIISFGADEPEAVCGDTLEWMDARTLALAETFSAAGAEVVPRVDYYWLTESWWEQDVCSVETAHACAVDNVIHSQSVPLEHELVHALRRKKLPRVFEEGLAELYGDLGLVDDPAPREELLEMLESGDPGENPQYARASHFVGFLVESYGLEPLLAIGDHAGLHASWTETQAAFEKAYGFPLQDALSEYESYPECSPLAWTNIDIACAQDPVPVELPQDGSAVTLSQQFVCGEPEIRGPLWGRMFTETTIELANPLSGWVLVRMFGDENPDAFIVLSGCGGCENAIWVRLGDGLPEQVRALPTGRYVLRVFRPIDDSGESAVSLSLSE
ncbi:MAG: hypothetical protein KC457_18815 [Myxococcales bacterium]|nr:hypothetical protein [Myxococcales bacterium]